MPLPRKLLNDGEDIVDGVVLAGPDSVRAARTLADLPGAEDVVFLGGPVIWFSHFMVVYLVAEAGCTGGGGHVTLSTGIDGMLLVDTGSAAMADSGVV